MSESKPEAATKAPKKKANPNDLFKAYAVDTKRLTDGVWMVFTQTSSDVVEESEIGDRVAIKLASTENPRYRHDLTKRLRDMAMRKEEVPVEEDGRMTGELVAENIILDWKNWEFADEPIPYSKGQVIEIWTDAKWCRLKTRIAELMGHHDAYKAHQEEAILKN